MTITPPAKAANRYYTLYCIYQALNDAALPEVLVVLGEAQVEGHHQPWQPAGAHQEHPEWETEHQQKSCGQRCSVYFILYPFISVNDSIT
jgi:hypothetical protein